MKYFIVALLFGLNINLNCQTIIQGNFQSMDGWSTEIYLLAITNYEHVFAATSNYHIDTARINSNGDFTFQLDKLPCTECLYRIEVRPKDATGPTIITGTSKANHSLFELSENQTISITGNADRLTKSFNIQSNYNGWSFSELRKLRDPIYKQADQLDSLIMDPEFTDGIDLDSLRREFIVQIIELLDANNEHLLLAMNESSNIYDKIIGSILYDYDMNLDKDLNIYESMSSQLNVIYPEHPYLIQYDKKIYDSKYVLPNGSSAPSLTLPDTIGNYINIDDMEGNLILIDFWASWCSPCRHENRNTVKPLYEKFKNEGFVVYSVSLDSNKDDWINAIKQDEMHWMNVSDLIGYQSPVYATYKIDALPTTYLVNKDDLTILAKNIRGKELTEFIEEFYAEK